MSVVLIVEDELLEQEFLKSVILEEISSEDIILTCESGVEAIKLAKQYLPNIIIMDIMIPELDGLSAIEEIRNFLPDICIIILSACSDFSYAQKAISLQISEYLLKPVKPAVFKQTFHKLLESASKSTISFEKNDNKLKECKQYFVDESIKYIKEHFRERLTLETVSSKVFVNTKYFSHAFKKDLGISFTDYVVKLRIEYACRLLETTNYHIYRISIECGFSDSSYFNRVFCSKMNMTPNAYRKYAFASKLKV